MSQPPSPIVPGNAAGDRETALTPEAIEAVLADFRTWLQQAAVPPPAPLEDGTEPIDLHTLLGQFLALKHEVNLQTRAVRAQQEQNAETLRHFAQSLEMVRQSQPRAVSAESPNEEEILRPLLKALVDVADALGLARREVGRVQEVLATHLDRMVEPAPAAQATSAAQAAAGTNPSFWARWFGASAKEIVDMEAQVQQGLAREEQQRQARQTAEQVRQFLESVITGYTMSLQRVERVLHQHGLEPIAAVGHPFDPERMEVVEAVTGSGCPVGEVVQEVRRGYLWRGRVFRYAQVSVAKGG